MNTRKGAMATEAKVNKLFGKATPATRQGTGMVKTNQPKTAPGGGPVKISAEPAFDQINWDHPKAELMYIQNKAILKNGRHVKW